MEPTISRTEPILDNRPHDGFGKGSQRLVYVLLAIFGIVLIGLGAYVRFVEKLSWLPEVCIAAGVAVSAPGILSYLYRKYMLDEIKLEMQKPAQEFKDAAVQIISVAVGEVTTQYRHEITLLKGAEYAGLEGVYISRPEAIHAFIPHVEDEKHEILLIGSSFKGLLKEVDAEYEHMRGVLRRKKTDGVRIRFLLTHPIVADLRAKQENRAQGGSWIPWSYCVMTGRST